MGSAGGIEANTARGLVGGGGGGVSRTNAYGILPTIHFAPTGLSMRTAIIIAVVTVGAAVVALVVIFITVRQRRRPPGGDSTGAGGR